MSAGNGSYRRLAQLAREPWDLIVVGGGITGAGIFRLATDLGLRTLLLEQQDFAWGTSSRSGKLVHGGLRYLKEGELNVTRHSVRERERLLREAPGLVEPLGFLFPIRLGERLVRAQYALGLAVYDLLAGRRTRSAYDKHGFLMLSPFSAPQRLGGGLRYEDAQADDARLVLRLIHETVADGGTARNYLAVEDLLTDAGGRVSGVLVRDPESGDSVSLAAKGVINATGAWADRLRARVGGAPCIRPLRGSHLVISSRRFPAPQALSFRHPEDGRPVYVLPWEGATLVGTTDVDHGAELDGEPVIGARERQYLMAGVQGQFPGLELQESDVISTFAGVRPVVGTGKEDPSRESREMVLLNEAGLVTITGGKLTTFRIMALKALQALSPNLSIELGRLQGKPLFKQLPALTGTAPALLARRIAGRYGVHAPAILAEAAGQTPALIPGTPYLWAELRHAAGHESVRHLDDLLLRRLRLGLLLPDGGERLLPRIGEVVLPELGWDGARWELEARRYLELRRGAYS